MLSKFTEFEQNVEIRDPEICGVSLPEFCSDFVNLLEFQICQAKSWRICLDLIEFYEMALTIK